jgi:hypothetical protein
METFNIQQSNLSSAGFSRQGGTVSPTSKSAGDPHLWNRAGLETCDTADLEVCATQAER